jgi:osmotically-inducible protein OsmY
MTTLTAPARTTPSTLLDPHQLAFTEQMAAVSIGAIFFGSFLPFTPENDHTRQALYKTTFLYRHFLSPAGIKPLVNRDILTIRGTSTSRAVIALAELLALQIPGIKKTSCEINRVPTESTDSNPTSGKPANPSEAELRERLQLILATDGSLTDGTLQATSDRKAIHLKGHVETPAQLAWVKTISKAILGNAAVSLNVTVSATPDRKPNRRIHVDDDSIQALCLFRLRLAEPLGSRELRIKSVKQSVLLTGKVKSEAEKKLAEEITSSTLGIRGFRSNVQVA